MAGKRTAEAAPESVHFELERLGDGVYAAIATSGGGAICNAGIVDLGDGVLVFDTFMDPLAAEDLRSAAESIAGKRVAYVVNSHWHNDHIRGNQVFDAETVVISTAKTRELIAVREPGVIKEEAEEVPAALEKLRARVEAERDENRRRELEMWVAYHEAILRSLPTLNTRLPSLTFERELTIQGPEREVKLHSFDGGHTESDAILYLPAEGIAFVSDLLFVGSHPYLMDGDLRALVRALRNVEALHPTAVVPGHGAVGKTEDLALMRDYVATVRRLAAESAEVESDEEMERRPVPPPFDDWKFGDLFQVNLQFARDQLSKSA